MATFNVHEAKTHFSRLIERALAGEEIVIAKSGKPLVRLTAVEDRRPRTPGLAKGRLTEAFFEPLAEDDLSDWGQ
jgi:prevent-host-death family protein